MPNDEWAKANSREKYGPAPNHVPRKRKKVRTDQKRKEEQSGIHALVKGLLVLEVTKKFVVVKDGNDRRIEIPRPMIRTQMISVGQTITAEILRWYAVRERLV